MSNILKQFKKIDALLAKYYQSLGRSDYYGENGNGQFLQFVINQELDDESLPIEDELGIDCDPHDCSYTDFDPEFPIPTNLAISSNYEKEKLEFYILQYCYKYNQYPSIECM